jgi:hypothetical protein
MKTSIILLAFAAITLFVIAVVGSQFKHEKLASWLLAACFVLLGIMLDRIYIALIW